MGSDAGPRRALFEGMHFQSTVWRASVRCLRRHTLQRRILGDVVYDKGAFCMAAIHVSLVGVVLPSSHALKYVIDRLPFTPNISIWK